MIAGAAAKRLLGPYWTVRARCVLRGYPVPRWGNLRRVRPFSENFGAERGMPVDRYYLRRFLEQHRADITGDVVEIQGRGHADRYGTALRRVDTIDINPRFAPTFCCDLAKADGIVRSNSYDCFLLPNTLAFLKDLDASLREALRIVKPGGVILASTMSLGPLIPDGPEYWRLTADGWREVTRRVWPDCEVSVTAAGNCLAAAAAVLGLAAEELDEYELDVNDPRYPVLVTIRCQKPRRDR